MAAIPRPQPQRPFSTAATMVLQAGLSLPPRRWCCRRAVPNCRNDGAAGGPFYSAATRVMQRFPILGLKSRIDAVQRPFLSFSLHRFPSLALKSRIDARKMAFSGKTMHRFPSLGLKSRITARKMAFPGKTLHRFASLALKSRIDARWRENPDRRLLRE